MTPHEPIIIQSLSDEKLLEEIQYHGLLDALDEYTVEQIADPNTRKIWSEMMDLKDCWMDFYVDREVAQLERLQDDLAEKLKVKPCDIPFDPD